MKSKRPLALVAALTGILAACSSQGGSSQAAAPSAAPLPIVAVSKATLANLATTVALTAEFEPFQEVDVMAKVSGYVRDMNVDIGDRVQEGRFARRPGDSGNAGRSGARQGGHR